MARPPRNLEAWGKAQETEHFICSHMSCSTSDLSFLNKLN